MITCDRQASLRISASLLVHFLLWGLLLGTLVIAGPRFEQYFADYHLKLPYLTGLVLSVCRFASAFLPVVALAFLMLLLVDGLLLTLAARRSDLRNLGRIWALLLAILPLALLLFFWLAFLYPAVKLHDGLSR